MSSINQFKGEVHQARGESKRHSLLRKSFDATHVTLSFLYFSALIYNCLPLAWYFSVCLYSSVYNFTLIKPGQSMCIHIYYL